MSSDATFAGLLRELARGPGSTLRSEDHLALVGTQLGHYRVEALLGVGGAGAVYRALDMRLDRRVALKVLRPRRPTARSAAEAIRKEARRAAAVAHPNVAAIYDVGEHDELAFIAMELVEGTTLRAQIDRGETPWREAVAIGRGIADGLAAAHTRSVVHGDLKPENTVRGVDGAIKLLDFGVARQIGPSPVGEAMTRPGGTPGYVAPEQRANPTGAADPRVDVYSFGVLLHELLAGRRPSRSGPSLPPTTPRRLARLVASCLADRPEQRPADGAALGAALEHCLRRRHRTIWTVGIGGLCALGLLVGGVLLVGAPGRPRPTGVTPAGVQRGGLKSRGRAARASGARIKAWPLTRNTPELRLRSHALSPNGQRIAFTDPRGLFVQPVAEGSPRRVAIAGPTSCVAWIDPRRLLVLRATSHNRIRSGKLAIVSTTGEGAIETKLRASTCPSVSADGRTIALADRELALVTLGDGTRRVLRRMGPNEWAVTSWSSDNRFVAACVLRHARQGGVSTRIEIWDVARHAVARVVEDARLEQPGGHLACAFVPDGRLVFARAKKVAGGSRAVLWALPRAATSTAPARRLGELDGPIGGLQAARDGRVMSYLRVTSQTDIYQADLLDGGLRLGPLRRRTFSDNTEMISGIDADGSLLFTADLGGQHRAYRLPPHSSVPELLSPLSESSAWPLVTASGETLLWRIERAGERVRALLQRTETCHALSCRERAPTPRHAGVGTRLGAIYTTPWASDRPGSTLPPPRRRRLLCPRRSGRCLIVEDTADGLMFRELDLGTWRTDPIGRSKLAAPRLWGMAITRDGERVAVANYSDAAIYVLTRRGKLVRRASIDPACNAFAAAWGGDDATLFVSATCAGPDSALFRIAPDGSTTRLLTEQNRWVYGVVASDDGRWLAIGITPFEGNVGLLELP